MSESNVNEDDEDAEASDSWLASGSPVYVDENHLLRDKQTGVCYDSRSVSMARVHNLWHGGKDYYWVDRDVAESIDDSGVLAAAAAAARAWQFHTTKHLIREHQISQFLDLGVGLPPTPYLHEVATRVDPEATVVYADYDPLIATYARALLDSPPDATYLHGDFTDPAQILKQATTLLDFAHPVAVSLVSVLEYMPPGDPHSMLSILRAHLAPGSFLLLASLTDRASTRTAARSRHELEEAFRVNGVAFVNRSHAEFAALFQGLDLLPPGVVPVGQWTATPGKKPRKTRKRKSSDLPCYVGLARKP
ncbi:S-adenosyl methyltransferase [Nocardia tenerifensis]|uniref:S-adenosyl methyltransferase n=1 Tax=Nocardia tenerifensis TaxID=228006 RepID=A0A318K190_9NOCA|nr:SAM-dependent methyltransferase [Nocardia tenerifensis]PXX53961.1 S-adenosyl methyltransferase [Nocardia tenerifensis]